MDLPRVPVTLNVFGIAFGDSARDREQASPLTHVRPGLPPFLIVSAGNDLPLLPAMAEEFHRALTDSDVPSTLLKVPGRNHNSVFFQMIDTDDPVARATLEFIRRNATR
jgi:acetyl esterase/lipase